MTIHLFPLLLLLKMDEYLSLNGTQTIHLVVVEWNGKRNEMENENEIEMK